MGIECELWEWQGNLHKQRSLGGTPAFLYVTMCPADGQISLRNSKKKKMKFEIFCMCSLYKVHCGFNRMQNYGVDMTSEKGTVGV